MADMSEPASSDQQQIPVWTLGWRLKRALDHGGVSAQEMALELGVHPGTVSRWMNDRETPRPIYVRAWAHRCRVPTDWLLYGDEHALPRVGSNHQPADFLFPSLRDRHLTASEKQERQETFRGLIRRGVFDPSAVRVSTVLPIASNQ